MSDTVSRAEYERLLARFEQLESDALSIGTFQGIRAARERAARRTRLSEIAHRGDADAIRALDGYTRTDVLAMVPDLLGWVLRQPDADSWISSLPVHAREGIRDELDLRRAELPRRVRMSALDPSISYSPQRVEVTDDQYQRLHAVGLGRYVAKIDSVTLGYLADPLTQPRILDWEVFDLMCEVDHQLRRYLSSGAIGVTELSDQENREHTRDLWSSIPRDQRGPIRARVAGPAPKPPEIGPNVQHPDALTEALRVAFCDDEAPNTTTIARYVRSTPPNA